MLIVQNETPLLLMSSALVAYFIWILRNHLVLSEEISSIEGENKIIKRIDLANATTQQLAILSVGVTAAIAWYQNASTNDLSLRRELTKDLSEIMSQIESTETSNRVSALVALENSARLKDEPFTTLLTHWITVRHNNLSCGIRDAKNKLEEDLICSISQKHNLNFHAPTPFLSICPQINGRERAHGQTGGQTGTPTVKLTGTPTISTTATQPPQQ